MGEADLKELAADIQFNGLQVPLVRTRDGQLLDGRNRLAACEAAGVPLRWETFEGDPFRYVVSINLQRRHLSDRQRAMIAARLAQLGIGTNQTPEDKSVKTDKWLLSYIDGQGGNAKAVDVYAAGLANGYDKDTLKHSRKRLGLTWTGAGNDWTWSRGPGTSHEVPEPREHNVPTHAQAAEMLNVSKASVDRSRMVLLHGTDELQKAVEEDVIPLASAARTAMAYSPEQQRDVVERLRNGELWRNVVPSIADAPDRRDLRKLGAAHTRVIRAAPGGVRNTMDRAMMLRLVSGLDGYAVGLQAVERIADDVTPDVINTAVRVFDRFGKTLKHLRRLLKEVRDDGQD